MTDDPTVPRALAVAREAHDRLGPHPTAVDGGALAGLPRDRAGTGPATVASVLDDEGIRACGTHLDGAGATTNTRTERFLKS